MSENKDPNQNLETNEFEEFLADLEPMTPEGEETSTPTTEQKPETEVETGTQETGTPAATPTPETSEEEDELTTLRKQNQALLEQIGKAYAQPAPVVAETPTAEPQGETDDPFGGLTFDQIIENEDSFKKFLTTFASKITERTEERLLKKLPTTVSKLTTEQIETRQTVNDFYATHKQLATVKPFVAQVVSTVASENAAWTLEQVLEESAKRAYKALGLKQQAVATEQNSSNKKPAFAGPAKGNRGEVNTAQKSKLERELEELMELE